MTQPAFDQIAPISRRAVAYVIDALIAGGLAVVLGGGLLVATSLSGGLENALATLMIGGPVVSLLLLAWFIVYTIMQAGNGSIGMRAQGVRLVSAADGRRLGFGRTLLRNIVFGLTAAIVVGYFTPLFDGSGRFQGWHDKAAGSLMLDARAAVAEGDSAVSAPAAATSALPVPGLATSSAAPVPGLPQPAAPVVPAAQAAPAAPAPASIPPRPAAPAAPVAEDGGLIAFVPGVTQDAPPRTTPAPSDVSELDATIQQHPTPPSAAAPAAAPAAPVAAPAAPVEAPQAPVAAPQAPAAAPVAPAAPAAETPVAPGAFSDADAADDLEETRISVPGHRLVFTWDDGTRVSVSRRTVFGRNPALEEGATIVPVRDETLSLSKTHFEAAASPSGGWILDRHSTNGMTIVRDGQRIACPAGQRVPVRLGDAIEIGDRIVTIGGYA